MHVVFSFTINQSNRKQIDEHIFNFEQYHAAKKEGHQTKPRDPDTAGAAATELKVRYPQNSGKFTYTHDLDHPVSNHAPCYTLIIIMCNPCMARVVSNDGHNSTILL